MPLQGAAAIGFFSETPGGVARGEWLRRKKCAHKTQVLSWQMNLGLELGSLWYDSGMIRGMIRKPIFLNSESFVD